jgi:hypothetical protein
MSVKEWIVAHLPPWLIPLNPWGAKGRPEMPEKHALVNRQTELNLRLDRLDLDRLDRLQANARLERWREQRRD